MAQFTTTDQYPIAYSDSNPSSDTAVPGTAIIFIHGWGAHGGFWKHNQPEINKTHRVICIDQRGHGQSAKLAEDVKETFNKPSMERLAKDIEELRQHLNLDNLILVGWSMGAHVMMKYIEIYGIEQVKGAVVVDMTPKIITDKTWSLGLKQNYTKATNAMVIPMMKMNWVKYVETFGLAVLAEDSTNEALKAEFVDGLKECDSKTLMAIWQSMCEQDFRKILPSITCPSMIIHGTKSQLYNEETGQYYADNLGNGKLINMADTGHSPHMEDPATFNRHLKAFIGSL
ncbi:MAG: alpha/beta hydrolase [Cellvibrionaceae bacterium]